MAILLSKQEVIMTQTRVVPVVPMKKKRCILKIESTDLHDGLDVVYKRRVQDDSKVLA